ncbi:uncharacterized protein I206_106060 [Kwoniella pini CBS 10737]|uniref:Uncharacterized protein n=1 Tax=Kwoniella pini CBS 10737 TaxID=1296096 RepID=A0A1B9I106_9TREE|nr:uncharacterized protein I206_04883 [Kwoniella pini CBS 10737]OCF49195.1 hypothetical protein I206_04883 [Kwoniella pini CBS 10737]
MQINDNANNKQNSAVVPEETPITTSEQTPVIIQTEEVSNGPSSHEEQEAAALHGDQDISGQFASLSLFAPYIRIHPYSPLTGEAPRSRPSRSREQVGDNIEDQPESPRGHSRPHHHHHGHRHPPRGHGSFDDPRLFMRLPPFPRRDQGRFPFLPPPGFERHGHPGLQEDMRFGPHDFEEEFDPAFFGPPPPHGRGMRGRGGLQGGHGHHHKGRKEFPHHGHKYKRHHHHKRQRPENNDGKEENDHNQSDINEKDTFAQDEVISLSSESQSDSTSASYSETLPEAEPHHRRPHHHMRGMFGGRGRGGMRRGPRGGYPFEHDLNTVFEFGLGPDHVREFGPRGMPHFGRHVPPTHLFGRHHDSDFMGSRERRGMFGHHDRPAPPPFFGEGPHDPFMSLRGHHHRSDHQPRRGPPPFDMPYGTRGGFDGGRGRGRGGFSHGFGFGHPIPTFA